jgi:uncharacterized LabA/DUF88 family protein
LCFVYRLRVLNNPFCFETEVNALKKLHNRHNDFIVMIVLVDYDNIPRVVRQRGVQNVVNKILQTIGVSHLRTSSRVRIRLYGGWYERNTLSRQAQQLAADVQLYYPQGSTISDGTSTINIMTVVELAYSMEIDPGHVLEDTYRNRNMPQGLRCNAPPYAYCSNTSTCRLFDVYQFIRTDSCPEVGCNVAPFEVLHKSEQKLVDTMLTADIIYLANQSLDNICVISSDDDLWPGIKSALLAGGNILHIHTRTGRPTPFHYRRNAGSKYTELYLS